MMKKIQNIGIFFFLITTLSAGIFTFYEIDDQEITYSSTGYSENECDEYVKANSLKFKKFIFQIHELNKAEDGYALMSYVANIDNRNYADDFTYQLIKCSANYRFSNYVDYFDKVFQTYLLLMYEVVKHEDKDSGLVEKYIEAINNDVDIIIASKKEIVAR